VVGYGDLNAFQDGAWEGGEVEQLTHVIPHDKVVLLWTKFGPERREVPPCGVASYIHGIFVCAALDNMHYVRHN